MGEQMPRAQHDRIMQAAVDLANEEISELQACLQRQKATITWLTDKIEELDQEKLDLEIQITELRAELFKTQGQLYDIMLEQASSSDSSDGSSTPRPTPRETPRQNTPAGGGGGGGFGPITPPPCQNMRLYSPIAPPPSLNVPSHGPITPPRRPNRPSYGPIAPPSRQDVPSRGPNAPESSRSGNVPAERQDGFRGYGERASGQNGNFF